MRTHPSLWAFLVGLSALPAAAAETVGVLAVSEPPGPGPELTELTLQLHDVLARKTAGVLDASQLRERMMGQTSTSSLSELDRAYAGALARYQAGEYEAAIRTLRAVIQDLERLPESPEAFEQWSRDMLRLARAEQSMQRDGEAQALLDRLVRANPQVKVDPAQYPPSFVRLVESVRVQQKGVRTAKLTVNAEKGVRVFVDGRDVGLAPVVVSLPPGRYRVSGQQKALRVPGVLVTLAGEDASVALDLELAQALRPGAGPGLALPAPDRVRRIITASASLALDRVVVTTLAHEADVTFLVGTHYDVRRGAVEREGRVRLAVNRAPPTGGLDALAAFLMLGETSPIVDAIDPLRPSPELQQGIAQSAARQERERGRSGVLGWSAIGAGGAAILAGGVAVYYSVQSGRLNDDADAMLGPDGRVRLPYTTAQYNAKVADADRAQKMAIGTGIGAGAALATGAVLGYLSYRQTGEIGPFRF
jgi:tetratricopeptide (TPR) repeat protein